MEAIGQGDIFLELAYRRGWGSLNFTLNFAKM